MSSLRSLSYLELFLVVAFVVFSPLDFSIMQHFVCVVKSMRCNRWLDGDIEGLLAWPKKKCLKTKISSASADYSGWFMFGGEEDAC